VLWLREKQLGFPPEVQIHSHFSLESGPVRKTDDDIRGRTVLDRRLRQDHPGGEGAVRAVAANKQAEFLRCIEHVFERLGFLLFRAAQPQEQDGRHGSEKGQASADHSQTFDEGHFGSSSVGDHFWPVFRWAARVARQEAACSLRPQPPYNRTSRSSVSARCSRPAGGMAASCSFMPLWACRSRGSASAYFSWASKVSPSNDRARKVVHAWGCLASHSSRHFRQNVSALSKRF